jgi:YhcH/YjgK/YiaL family protein
MIVCSLEQLGRYRGLSANLDAAAAWLASDAWKGLADGRHGIDGDRIYASISSYDTRTPEALRWETHRVYIDIQVMLAGREEVLVQDAAGLLSSETYKPEKDVEFYDSVTSSTRDGIHRVTLSPGLLGLFFPEDAHAPCAAIGAQARVRKLVVKVAVA